MSDQTVAPAAIPDSQRPKVKATYVAGAGGAGVGAVLVSLWNGYVGEFSPLYLDAAAAALLAGALTTFVAGVAGPLLRKYQSWAENGDTTSRNMIVIAKRLKATEDFDREVGIALKALSDRLAALEQRKDTPT